MKKLILFSLFLCVPINSMKNPLSSSQRIFPKGMQTFYEDCGQNKVIKIFNVNSDTLVAWVRFSKKNWIGVIHYIQVNIAQRKKGLGYYLLTNACNKLKQEQCCRVELQVAKQNLSALRLYAKCRFIIKSENDSWLILKKDL